MLGALIAIVVMSIILFTAGRRLYNIAKKNYGTGFFWTVLLSLSMLIVPLILVVADFSARCVDGILPNYSEGERIGYVTKLSYKGVIWKTHEGQLQVGQGAQVAVQKPFDFSVVDEGMLDPLNEAMTKGKKVKLRYREWWAMPYRLGDSGYEIIGVEELR